MSNPEKGARRREGIDASSSVEIRRTLRLQQRRRRRLLVLESLLL
ncbi:hypothetical protein [Candidatus Solincola sp.]|nr:hypothetical protein [Actinomycetota bacterium]